MKVVAEYGRAMNTDIVVALIGAGALLAGQLLVRRQATKDLRANIDRDVNIVRRLNPESAEAKLLEQHIRSNIVKLITRERRQTPNEIWVFGSFSVTSFAIAGLGWWRGHGVPEVLRVPVEVFYWFLWVVYAVLLVRALTYLLEFGKIGVKVGVLGVRLRWNKVRLWYLKRKNTKVRKQYEALRQYDKIVVDYMHEHKDDIVAKIGQQEWDDLMAERAELDAMAEEIDARHRARDDDAEEDPPAAT
jgi:hypothetical protein